MGIDYTFEKKKCKCCGHADEIVKGGYGASRWSDEGLNSIFTERMLNGCDVVDLNKKDIEEYLKKIKDGQFKNDSIAVLDTMKKYKLKKVTLIMY